jgi:hypothetical protein
MAIGDEPPSKGTGFEKRPRFSLSAVLLSPLALSPTFLSLYLASDIITHRMQEFGAAIWILAFAYSSILIVFWYRATCRLHKFDENPFSWCLQGGGRAGLLYGLLFCLPLETARIIFLAGKMSAINIAGQTVGPGIAIVVFSTLTGLAAGGIIGLFLSHRKSRGLTRRYS